MRPITLALAAAGLAVIAASARAGDPRLAPLPPAEATVVHGPYLQGDCDTCHARRDPKDPGPAQATRETCLGCHDDFDGKAPVRIAKGKHHTSQNACTSCHNPHNSKKKNLLL